MTNFDTFKTLIKKFAKVWLIWHTPENMEKQHEAADGIIEAVKIGMEFANIAKEVLTGETDSTSRAPGVRAAMVNEIAEELRREWTE